MKHRISIISALAAALLLVSAFPSPAAGRHKTIRILAIGNSFSTDAVEQELYGLFEAEGYDVVIGNMYIGGCPLTKHAAYAKSDTAAYSYRKIVDGVLTKTDGVSLSTAINDEKWDYISIQEGGGFHGFYYRTFNGISHSMEPDLTDLADFILEHRPTKRTKLAYHIPWAAQEGSVSRKFSFYGCDQMTMYWMICEAAAQVLAAHPEFDLMLNTMDAIQNARTSWLGDTLNRDGWHLSYTRGRYTASCLWFEKITGKSVVGNTYHPEKLSDEEAFICQTAAHEACLHPFQISDLSGIKRKARVYDVRSYGAVGDGVAIDSPAIDKAIEAAANEGGGQVLVPAGTYLCYSIHLKSGVDLHLGKGAVIKAGMEARFDTAEPGPDPQYQDFGHSHWHNSLIWGEGLRYVTISGEGMIDASTLSCGFGDSALKEGIANKAISLKDCNYVTLNGFTVLNGGHFCILATGVNNLQIIGLTLDTLRDGMDIDCCCSVQISGCRVNSTWDDGIVLKSSYALGRFKDTENVTISDCQVSGYEAGTLLDKSFKRVGGQKNPHTGTLLNHRSSGRIKIGTESSGSFRHITITNCQLDYCGGVLIESMDGGIVEDVTVSGITMRDCQDCPLFFRLGSRMRSPEGTPTGTIRRVTVCDVDAINSRGMWPMMIAGIPGHKVHDLTLKDIRINYEGGYSAACAQKSIPENEKGYPDPWIFSRNADDPDNATALPYRCMMLRHAEDITLDHVSFSFNSEDTRDDFFIEDAPGVKFIPDRR